MEKRFSEGWKGPDEVAKSPSCRVSGHIWYPYPHRRKPATPGACAHACISGLLHAHTLRHRRNSTRGRCSPSRLGRCRRAEATERSAPAVHRLLVTRNPGVPQDPRVHRAAFIRYRGKELYPLEVCITKFSAETLHVNWLTVIILVSH